MDALVDQALGENLDLAAAWARLEAAQQVVIRERADLIPGVDGYARVDVGTDQPFGGLERVPLRVGLSTQYEVDLWGRVRAEVRGERERAEATRADYQAAALSLSAEVAQAWYGLRAARLSRQLLAAQVEANEQLEQLVQASFAAGQERQATLLRQARQVESARAQLLSAQAELEVLAHQLAVLLGQPPQGARLPAERGEPLPGLPPVPEAGLPLELVERRPDVRAAWHALLAADADAAAAARDRLPKLTLGPSLEAAPSGTEALLQAWVGSLTASLAAPLIDGRQRKAEWERSRAVAEQRLAEYGAAVLTAFQEVEDCLSWERAQAARVQSLRAQVALSRSAADQLRGQFAAGMVRYIDVLSETTALWRLERELIQAQLAHIQVRVDLHRALAGPFETPKEAQP